MAPREWRLLGEAWVALARARRRIARQPMSATIADLHQASRPRREAVDATPIVRAVLRAKHLFPVPMLCLPESVALAEMLVIRGQPCALVLGARLEGGGLDAHAWVEQNDIPINSPLTSATDHPVYLRERFECRESAMLSSSTTR
jgi:hypothetical protein